LPRGTDAFAATMAAWRFYHNERVRLDRLVQPLIEHVRSSQDREALYGSGISSVGTASQVAADSGERPAEPTMPTLRAISPPRRSYSVSH
jgi:hypothetical protein